MSEPIVLGIESTCDETAAAVVQGRTLISNVVASSMDEHARYGGVNSRNRLSRARRSVRAMRLQSSADANMTLSDVDAIAVSAGPGLAGCLAVGVSGAKSLAWAREQADLRHQPRHRTYRGDAAAVRTVPQGHACVDCVGGHTSLLHVEDVARHIDVVGTTLDDAAGECFDKVARLLGFRIPAARTSTVTRSWATHMPSKCLRALHKARRGSSIRTISVSPA